MLDGLYAAAAGMSAQQEQLNAIANNLANSSTDGYHAQQVAFSELLHGTIDEAGTDTSAGAGAVALSMGASSAQGAIRQTGQPLDLAIQGEGFFELKRAGGQLVLSRDGAFGLNAQRQIVNPQGDTLDPPITVPAGIAPGEVAVASDGTVTAAEKPIGKIALVNVASPQHLLAAGEGAFVVTQASGEAKPSAEGAIIQGALEGSDVELGAEMASMVSTERTYQMTSTAVNTEGQMMSIANQIYTSA